MADWEREVTDPPHAGGDYRIHPRMPELTSLFRDATAADFFEILALCLADPAYTRRSDSAEELSIVARLAEVGITGIQPFVFADLDGVTRSALERGYAAGKRRVAAGFATSFIQMNGWALGSNWGWFGTDFLRRSVAAAFGWGGAGPHSHTAAFLFNDADSQPLDGSQHTYTMTFQADDLPPVRNHWELPIYDTDGYFVANEINRYSLNSYMLDRNELHIDDGTLTIYIQHDRPTDPDHVTNWLPAPTADSGSPPASTDPTRRSSTAATRCQASSGRAEHIRQTVSTARIRSRHDATLIGGTTHGCPGRAEPCRASAGGPASRICWRITRGIRPCTTVRAAELSRI